MNSFRLVYDAEGDILEVDFRLVGGKPQRGFELNENVVVWTDSRMSKVYRILFISYSRLLHQPALTFNLLKKLPALQREKLQRIIERDPVKQFLHCHDRQKCQYRLSEPDLTTMVKAA